MKYALISVYDKTNLDALVGSLKGYTIISTGGTYKAISEIIKKKKLSIVLKSVSEVTGSPEMLGGRVKSLHPMIHGSILWMRDRQKDEAKKHKLLDIDLVAVNLYPFEETVKSGAGPEDCIEMIDIGGPTMLISAVKNFKHVTVLVNPEDYSLVPEINAEQRKRLAAKAINALADYRGAIAVELSRMLAGKDTLRLSYPDGGKLGKYGENWHQDAWYFGSSMEKLAGIELGYNNYLDIDAALLSVLDLVGSAGVSVVKHNNPCGYATGETLAEALLHAWEGDDVSAFGSVIAFSEKLDMECAQFFDNKFVEILVVPDIDRDALDYLREKKKNLRIVRRDLARPHNYEYRGVQGGMLMQTADGRLYLGDLYTDTEVDGRRTGIVTRKKIPQNRKGLLEFAIKSVKHLRSNAISICMEHDSGYSVIGMGCGQPNRINSVRLAMDKAVYNLKKEYSDDEVKEILGSDRVVLASDAFFPFGDSIEEISKHGIMQVVQPGGSIRDKDVIEAADESGIAMSFSGMRHFRH